MRPMTWITPMMALTACATAQAQASLVPHRLSLSFHGQVPLLWEVEGRGALRGAKLRLLDEGGKEIWTWQNLEFRSLGKGRWQAWTLESPAERFKGLVGGRYTLICRMLWDQEGQVRQEETETGFVLEGRGDGWLSKAFLSSEGGPVTWRVDSQWPKGANFKVEASSAQGLRSVRYQLIAGKDESVLRPWADLPLKGQHTWGLKADPAWPEGPATLWLLEEGIHGEAWVETREVWIGRRSSLAGGGPMGAEGSLLRNATQTSTQGVAAASYADAASVANAEWLRNVDNPGTAPAWDQSNRVATVTFGYWDVERNENGLFPLSAQTQWRPMSFSLTGANGLGKPLYGVGYLLAAGASPDTVVEEATRNTFILPQGAQTLQVGAVPAPVVFSAGTVEDFLGKPLAAGYSFAATSGDTAGYPGSGTNASGGPAAMSAWDWSQQANPGSSLGQATVPQVGVDAIQAAARYRAHLQAQIKSDLGNTNPEADLDGNRDPYAMTFTSQDPMGRTVLTKALGSRLPEQLDVSLPPVKVPMGSMVSNLVDNFDGELANWYRLGPGTQHVFPASNTNGSIQLQPDYSLVWTLFVPIYLAHYSPGTFTVNLGLALPGRGPISVGMSYQGTLRLDLVDDTGNAVWSQSLSSASMTAMPTLIVGGASGVWSPTVPTSLRMIVTNTTPSQSVNVSGGTIPDSAYVRVDNLSVSTTQTYQGLKVPETTLDDATHPALPGYSRTQYGTIENSSAAQNGYPVTMVTDPDGASVAEVKDLEGRTVLKVVNPDATYTNSFMEYRLGATGMRTAFRPSSPKTRGLTGGVSSGPQTNLVSQYVFDAEGQLRAVIPPKGLVGKPWGLSLKDSDLDGVLSAGTTDFNGVQGRAQALAPFATFNAYDYAGHLVATYNPDEGLTRFLVDQKGRVHYSQTEKQRKAGTWTRTLYDGIFRVLGVGELTSGTTPVSDLESITTYDPASSAYTTAIASFTAASLSQNVYDDYQGLDPTSATSAPGLDPKVQALLPKPTLWSPFPDGHLTMAKDASAIERYFYDQDGRVVIRWTTLNPSGAASRQFAIGIYYDFAGRVKRLVYPSGPGGDPLQVVYSYDDLGRLYAVGTTQDGAYFARYAYHPTGELRAMVYGPGKGFVAKQMLQDPQGWLRSLQLKAR